MSSLFRLPRQGHLFRNGNFANIAYEKKTLVLFQQLTIFPVEYVMWIFNQKTTKSISNVLFANISQTKWRLVGSNEWHLTPLFRF